VELHIDSLVVARNITDNKSSSIIGKSLVERIRRLLELDWEVVVRHSYREANFCADALANHGCLMENDSVFFAACPSKFSLCGILNLSSIREILIRDSETTITNPSFSNIDSHSQSFIN
jgi:hypothetical protein